MKFHVRRTNRFRSDYQRAMRRGLPMARLDTAIELLAKGERLPASLRDHSLAGVFTGCRECHVAPDWLLVYRVDGDVLVLTLIRTGSHSDRPVDGDFGSGVAESLRIRYRGGVRVRHRPFGSVCLRTSP